MTLAPAKTERSEVFDRILGLKGDMSRLEPAIRAAAKSLASEMQASYAAAGIAFEIELESHGDTTLDALFDAGDGGRICVLLGDSSRGPLAYMTCDYAGAGTIGEIMLGGDPELVPAVVKRPPTSLERQLIGQFSNIAGKALKAALQTPAPPSFLRVAIDMEELRGGDEAQPLVGFDITASFGEATLKLTFALTHRFLLQMERRKNPMRRPSGSTGKSAAKTARNARAMTVAVPVTATIALDPMSLRELAGLRPGMVLPLPETDGANVRLKARGRPLYDCSLGRKGANYALSLHRPHQALNEALNGIGVPSSDTDDKET